MARRMCVRCSAGRCKARYSLSATIFSARAWHSFDSLCVCAPPPCGRDACWFVGLLLPLRRMWREAHVFLVVAPLRLVAQCAALLCVRVPPPALTAGWVMVRAGHDSGCECDTLAFRTGQEDTLEGHSPDGGRVSCRPHSQRVLGARHRRALCVSEDGYRHDEALLVTGSRTGCTRIHRPGPSPCPRKGVRLGALAVARRSSRLSFPRVY